MKGLFASFSLNFIERRPNLFAGMTSAQVQYHEQSLSIANKDNVLNIKSIKYGQSHTIVFISDCDKFGGHMFLQETSHLLDANHSVSAAQTQTLLGSTSMTMEDDLLPEDVIVSWLRRCGVVRTANAIVSVAIKDVRIRQAWIKDHLYQSNTQANNLVESSNGTLSR